MFHTLGSEAKRKNDSILGFNTNTSKVLYDLDKKNPLSTVGYDYTGIFQQKMVMFVPLSGLINADKYLPLRYMGGLTFELELITDPTECLMFVPYTAPANPSAVPPTEAIIVQQDNLIGNKWHISQFCIKADVLTIDNNLNDEYVKFMLSGKALALNYNTYISQMQTTTRREERSQQLMMHYIRSVF